MNHNRLDRNDVNKKNINENVANKMINAGDTTNNKNNSKNSVHTNSINVSL